MTKIMLAACLLSMGLAAPVLAANADHPYQNCDHKVDNCGPTGNATTDDLNARQLGASPSYTPGAPRPSDDGGVPTGQGVSR